MPPDYLSRALSFAERHRTYEKNEKNEISAEPKPTSKELLREELRQALVKGNRWLHRWHMKYDAPVEGSALFAKIMQEWYEREEAFTSLFDPDGCVLETDGPCWIPVECRYCQ